MGMLSAGFSVFKNWQNGYCDAWESNGWSSEFSCYATNAIEDGLFFGAVLTAVGAHFHPPAHAHGN